MQCAVVNSKQQQFGIGSVADLIPGRGDRLVDSAAANVFEAVVTASKAMRRWWCWMTTYY